MKIYKAYRFRIYPTKEQMYKEENKTYLLKDMKKDLVNLQAKYPWLKEVDGCILRTSLEDL